MKLFTLLLFLTLSLNLFAVKKIDNLIIFRVITDENISKSNIDMINTSVETNLTSLGYGIINEKIQNEALEEQKEQQKSECYDDQCLVDTGRMLAAKKLLIIRITKQKTGNFFIKLRKIDIESGIIENSFASTSKLEFNDYELLNKVINALLKKIFKENIKSNAVKSSVPVSLGVSNSFKFVKVVSNVDNVGVYSNKNLDFRYKIGRTPLRLKVHKNQPRIIYLLKFGYIVREYELNYNSPDKIKLILDEAPKYKLRIDTLVDYNISYTPLLNNQVNVLYSAYKNYLHNNFSKTKYFKRNSKIIYLPQGRYRLVLKKKGYRTVSKTVNLNKDEVVKVQDKKEILSFGGIEFLTEYKKFININDIKSSHFHVGTIISFLTLLTQDIKADFLRFGFLSDFKSNNSLKDIKFSFINVEAYPNKNLYFSVTLGYFLGDGDIILNTDADYTLMSPIGIKIGYKINLMNDKFSLKFYQKTDWLIYINRDTENNDYSTKSQNGLSLTFGASLEYIF